MLKLLKTCVSAINDTQIFNCISSYSVLTALMMAEAKQREKDRRKLLREQERAARMEQLRVEREVRAQQYLEVCFCN